MKAKSAQTQKKPAARKQATFTCQPQPLADQPSRTYTGYTILAANWLGKDRQLDCATSAWRQRRLSIDGWYFSNVSRHDWRSRPIANLYGVWSDGALRKIAGWITFPVATPIGRLFKEVTEKQTRQFESLNHRLRRQIWRLGNRAGVSKVGLNRVQWVAIHSFSAGRKVELG